MCTVAEKYFLFLLKLIRNVQQEDQCCILYIFHCSFLFPVLSKISRIFFMGQILT